MEMKTLSFLIIALFLISFSSAFEFDNVKSYNEELKVVTISNCDLWLGVCLNDGEALGQSKLITPQHNLVGISPNEKIRVAEFDISSYSDYDDILKQFTFIDMKTENGVERDIDIKFRSYEDYLANDTKEVCYDKILNKSGEPTCEEIIIGTHTEQRELWLDKPIINLKAGEAIRIGLYTTTEDGDYIDWVPTIYGVKVEEWATWTADLNTNLVFYLKLNNSYNDSLGTHHGTALNSPPFVSGIIGNGTSMTAGSSQKITITNNTDLNFGTGDFAFNMWYKTGNVLFSTQLASASYQGMNLEVHSSGVYVRFSSGSGTSIDQDNFQGAGWQMLTFQRSGTNVSLWINGTYKNSTTSSANLTGGTDLTFAWIEWASYYTTSIDEVSIYKGRALSKTEIEQYWNSGAGITYNNDIPDTSPQVALTSPVNNSNFTSSPQDFVGAVTDNLYVQNVSLKIDGAIVETDTSHTNGTYTFDAIVITEGRHNWSILAYDNASQSNTSAVWFYNYTQPPLFIVQESPTDLSTSQIQSVNVSCYAYESKGVTQLNLTINNVVRQTVVNSSQSQNLSIKNISNYAEGQFNWSCSAKNLETSASSTNRTFTVNYSSPQITLNSPVNTYNSTSSSITFNTTVTDLNGVLNTSLYIDGVLNETNSSGGNNTYIFTKSVADGNHNWSIRSVSTLGKINNSATRTFQIDSSVPTINITAPPTIFDYLVGGDVLFLNWTVSDLNLASCWYVYNTQETAFSDETGNSGVLIDGNKSTLAYINGNLSIVSEANLLNLTFVGSPTPTESYYNIDISNCSIASDKKTLVFGNAHPVGGDYYQWVLCDNNLITNITKGGFGNIQYPAELNLAYNSTNVSCSANTTTFHYTQGLDEITFFASDTYGNIANETRTWTTLIGTFSVDYTSPVYEGELNTLTAVVTPSSGSSITSAVLHYNGDNYTTNIDYGSGIYNISATIPAPLVDTDTNFTFGFYLTMGGIVYDPQQNNQTVLNLDFGECGVVSNDTLMTMFLYDEDSRTNITGDIEINAQITSKSSGEEVGEVNFSFSDIGNASICFSPLGSYNLYYLDAEIRYVSDGYAPEFYIIQSSDLGDYPVNLSLFDLNLSASTEFLLKYQDDNLVTVEGAVIQLLRKYISTGNYETVEAPLTSNIGTAVVHINLNTNLYKAIVVKDGIVLDEFSNIVFNCENELSGICTQNLFGSINPQNSISLDQLLDFWYSISEVNNTITTTFSVPSGVPYPINVYVKQVDTFGEEYLCNTTVISSSGSIDCVYNKTIGDSVIYLTLTKDDVEMAYKSYIIPEENGLDWLGGNFFIVLMFLLSLVGMAMASPEWMVIVGIMTFVFSGGVWLLNGLTFVTGLGTIIWLVVASAIIIFKMAKQEDK